MDGRRGVVDGGGDGARVRRQQLQHVAHPAAVRDRHLESGAGEHLGDAAGGAVQRGGDARQVAAHSDAGHDAGAALGGHRGGGHRAHGLHPGPRPADGAQPRHGQRGARSAAAGGWLLRPERAWRAAGRAAGALFAAVTG